MTLPRNGVWYILKSSYAGMHQSSTGTGKSFGMQWNRLRKTPMHNLQGRLNLPFPLNLMNRQDWRLRGNFSRPLRIWACVWTGLTITKNSENQIHMSMQCLPCVASKQMAHGTRKKRKHIPLTNAGNAFPSLTRPPENRRSVKTEERCGNVKQSKRITGIHRTMQRNGGHYGQIL